MKISNEAVDAVIAAEKTDGALVTILSFIELPTLCRMRTVSKRWKKCADEALKEYSKKAFENDSELMRAVDAYCLTESRFEDLRFQLPTSPPVLRYRKYVVECMYGKKIGTWNVSKVKRFDYTFSDMIHFNESIEDWDVSNATDIDGLEGMFLNAAAFNQPLSKWDVSNVENMQFIFKGATSFDQDLSSWNTDKVNEATLGMFIGSPLADRLREDPDLLKKWGWDILVSKTFEEIVERWRRRHVDFDLLRALPDRDPRRIRMLDEAWAASLSEEDEDPPFDIDLALEYWLCDEMVPWN